MGIGSDAPASRGAGAQASIRPDTDAAAGHGVSAGPGRYEFRFTGDEETRDLLREAQELLSHALPNGDMAEIVKRGLAFVVADARRKRFAATDSPRAARDCAPDTRHVPAEVTRTVWARDGGRCAFVGSTGRRCEERRFLEYHHLKPWMVGGEASAENIALRCRTHNQYEAKIYFAPIRRSMNLEV